MMVTGCKLALNMRISCERFLNDLQRHLYDVCVRASNCDVFPET